MIIKEIDLEDLSAMVEIERENFKEPWDYKTLFYEVIKNTKTSFYGAYVDNKLVGYLGFWSLIDNIDIINIAVAKEFKRLGIASKLFEHLDEIAKALEIKTITLEVNVNNYAAFNLYKKMGFIIVRTIKNYYSKTSEDAYMMQKEVFNG